MTWKIRVMSLWSLVTLIGQLFLRKDPNDRWRLSYHRVVIKLSSSQHLFDLSRFTTRPRRYRFMVSVKPFTHSAMNFMCTCNCAWNKTIKCVKLYAVIMLIWLLWSYITVIILWLHYYSNYWISIVTCTYSIS